MTENTFSQGSGNDAELAAASIESMVQAAIAKGRARQQSEVGMEVTEPEGWWNLWAYGPFQFTAPGGPLRPHKIVKVGQSFYVATVLWLSDAVLAGGPSICDLISNLACDFELEYCTNDLCAMRKATRFSRTVVEPLRPNQCYYVNVQQFTAVTGDDSCIYEMNICGRITGCKDRGGNPPLAGYASAVYSFDADLFYPPYGPPGQSAGWRYDVPIRFMIYP